MTRAPAYPLVVHDPFFSIWSRTDALTDDWTTHWTGRPQVLSALIRVDGRTYRVMGPDTRMAEPRPALPQIGVEVTPTRTIYRFAGAGISLALTFTTPALPGDIDLMVRPLSYLTFEVAATDGAAHAVELYLDASATITTDRTEAPVIWGRHRHGAVHSLWTGAADQDVLGRTGDHCFTDWGYLHLSPDPEAPSTSAIGEARALRDHFATEGYLSDQDGVGPEAPLPMPTPASGGEGQSIHGQSTNRQPMVMLALSRDLGEVAEAPAVWHAALAYDHVWQIEYHHRRLRPLWHRKDGTAIAMIARGWADRAAVMTRCAAFDADLTQDMTAVGGAPFARLGSLAFRQCLGGHGLVADRDGTLLHFSKENSSNGCLGTVDLTYPGAPFFLLFNPDLLMAQMRFILDYAAGPNWPFAFAPHDIGRYPIANGQVYGGGETGEADQMPFEECGNMLILAAAYAQVTDGAEALRGDWPVLAGWADYLVGQGHDPGEQLCTDDFDGHMAHNVNLSLKAILGLGAAAALAERLGEDGARFGAAAKAGAEAWLAAETGGPHRRQTFDRPGSWSLKYNLVWDRFLGLDLFPPEVADGEMAKYHAEMGPYGVPLSSVAGHTKLDWLVWAATLTGKRADLDAILARIDAWLDETPDRVPLSDWYEVGTGGQARGRGFLARPVVGGVFMPMMLDKKMLEKWRTAR